MPTGNRENRIPVQEMNSTVLEPSTPVLVSVTHSLKNAILEYGIDN